MTAATTTFAPSSTVPLTKTIAGPQTEAAVRRAAEEFEAVFLAQMLAGMFQGLSGEGGGLGGAADPGGDVFEGMLREEYAKLISRSGGIGLAGEIRREMLKLQEVTT